MSTFEENKSAKLREFNSREDNYNLSMILTLCKAFDSNLVLYETNVPGKPVFAIAAQTAEVMFNEVRDSM